MSPSAPPTSPPRDPAFDPVLAKVRKLLAKAEDPAATPAEAETYTAKAAELVAGYGIDAALLADAEPGRDGVGDRVVVLDRPYARDKLDLLAAVGSSLRCRVVQRQRWVDGERQFSVHLFGFGADLQRAEVLYTSLLLQATAQLTRTVPPPGETVAAWRRSWLAGFTAAVGRRLRAAELAAERAAQEAAWQDARERAAAAGGRSVALVLADRDQQVEVRVQEEYPHLGQARTRRLSGSGAGAGWAAGQRADLGGARVGARHGNALTR